MIVGKFVTEMNELLGDRHIRVRLSEAAVDQVITAGFDPKMGARPVRRMLNDMVKVPLSKKILFENLGANTVVVVDYRDGAFALDAQPITASSLPVVDSDGFIVLA